MPSRRARSLVVPFIVAVLAAPRMSAQTHDHPAATAEPSAEAQKAFVVIKSLSGAWQGHVTEPTNNLKVLTDVSLRTTSRGNAVVHEIQSAEETDNPIKNDHPVTMMYLDGANLLLTHYCDSGNRPRMSARVSSSGKVVDFDFIDVVGSTKYGHMQHVRFTIIDDTHHIEDWTYELPDGKTAVGHFDLTRVASAASVKAK
jgi:hypothetical protein